MWDAETAAGRVLISIAFRIQRSKEADEELLGELASLNKRHKCNENRDVLKWLIPGCSAKT